MRIRTIKPEFWRSEPVDPSDRKSWKRFGDSGPGYGFLYRLYNASGQLLYVGITWNPHRRWTAHSKTKRWWPEVSHAELWRCRDKDARHWETQCIKQQRPIHNIHQAVTN